MTFRNQIGNENVMSAYLGEEMYKESSSTDDGKRGQNLWQIQCYLVLCPKDGEIGEICAECGAGTFVTDSHLFACRIFAKG